MSSNLQLICVYDADNNIYYGWLQGMEHIIGEGRNDTEVMADVMDSIAIVADYKLKQQAKARAEQNGQHAGHTSSFRRNISLVSPAI